MTQLLLFNVTNGLIIGAFYVLMALGLSLILNLSNVINFAHVGFLVIGSYTAYTITPSVGVLCARMSLGFGMRLRAGSLDCEVVAAMGFVVRVLRSLSCGVGISSAGLCGLLAAGELALEPTLGPGLL